MSRRSAKLQPVVVQEPIRLDLGCGKNKRQGFFGVDLQPFEGVDKVLDLTQKWAVSIEPKWNKEHTAYEVSKSGFKPWPWGDDSVTEVHCSHFLEHLDQQERVHFFNELYRVMMKDAKATIIVPSWTSERAYGDPTHKWPPVVGFSFLYLNKAWREANAPHTGYKCDFGFQGGNSLVHPWTLKNQEAQIFAQTHYLNVASDMWVTLNK